MLNSDTDNWEKQEKCVNCQIRNIKVTTTSLFATATARRTRLKYYRLLDPSAFAITLLFLFSALLSYYWHYSFSSTHFFISFIHTILRSFTVRKSRTVITKGDMNVKYFFDTFFSRFFTKKSRIFLHSSIKLFVIVGANTWWPHYDSCQGLMTIVVIVDYC